MVTKKDAQLERLYGQLIDFLVRPYKTHAIRLYANIVFYCKRFIPINVPSFAKLNSNLPYPVVLQA